MDRIYLSPPVVSEKEKEYINSAFDSNWIAPVGPDIDLFEEEISSYLNISSLSSTHTTHNTTASTAHFNSCRPFVRK